MKKFDYEKIKDKLGTVVSSEEALKDVVPFEWSKEVLSGEKKVIVEGTIKK